VPPAGRQGVEGGACAGVEAGAGASYNVPMNAVLSPTPRRAILE
jgi:hypothetical protein